MRRSGGGGVDSRHAERKRERKGGDRDLRYQNDDDDDDYYDYDELQEAPSPKRLRTPEEARFYNYEVVDGGYSPGGYSP